MASLDFEVEKKEFQEFYELNTKLMENAKNSFITLVNSLIIHAGSVAISKIEGRVKEKDECIKKFSRKYRTGLETKNESYSILNHITDLIGLRIVCLYEDDIEKIHSTLENHFDVIDVTDKTAIIENTEGSFGYKGLHLDLKLGDSRKTLPEYLAYANFQFEIQVRTIIQDSWSVLDHKIKYKKAIPNGLKRRINTLAALFELADREFRQIRESTEYEIKKAETEVNVLEVAHDTPTKENHNNQSTNGLAKLDAFGFLRIAKHFFKTYDFEDYKVDGFTQEINGLEPAITKSKFNLYMRNTISKVKRYQNYFEDQNGVDKINPFTIIRHCLYLADKDLFKSLLTNFARDSFDTWLIDNKT